jgi:GDP-L-fucose synthase
MMCKYYSENYKIEYKSLLPCNLFGPGDNYHDKNSHFFPSLLKKILDAKKKGHKIIKIWGSGKPKRELFYVDDLSSAVLFLMNKKIKEPFINIGSGKDHTIYWYANFLINYFKLNLEIKIDRSKPDGVTRKFLDISLLKKMVWKAQTSLKNSLSITVKDFFENRN